MTVLPAVLLAIAVSARPPDAPGRAAALAIGCAGCHAGPTALTERDADALYLSLMTWRNADDADAVMTRIARGFSPGELQAIAGYLASP